MTKRVRAHVNPLSITYEVHFEGFGNDKPIYVDVGAYKGEFMEGLAEQFPECNFILFEIRRPIAERLREKFKDRENFAIFHGDAGRNFRNILQPCIDQGAKIETIFVNFPDPWFKDRHKKRRFINPKFLDDCATWLPAETQFIFQTDQGFLFNETVEVLQESPYSLIKDFDEPPFGLRTDWEEAKIAEGNEIHRMSFWLGRK